MSLKKLTATLVLGWALWLAACQPQPNSVVIEVDGGRHALTVAAADTTVRDALTQANIELGKLDRVKPDLYTQLEPGLVIVVTRVREELKTTREVVPFERSTVVNEALAPGESRIAQLGVNGQAEITTRIVYENNTEVSRTEISRTPITPPVPEVMVIGPTGALPTVQVEGTIAYMANGNAWLIRSANTSRRALTTQGQLDGRVFGLSPDGRRLLYTTALSAATVTAPLNNMWLANTTIIGEPPITVGLQGVLHAEWSPVISRPLVAYSTATRSATPPGWQANNDLWLFAPPADATAKIKPVQIMPPNTQGLYPWWGASFSWSPDGSRLAYARADQIGVIQLITASAAISGTFTPLVDFTPLQTFSDWVWVPGLSWSPDGKFIAAVVHGAPLASESAEESQAFDLWLLAADGSISAKVAEQVGMWANPVWGPAGIAFGQAVNPLQSVNSRYSIQLIDRDGSNRRQIFPFQQEPGVQFPEMVWSLNGQQLLFGYNGNLYITGAGGGAPQQLSNDGQASNPRWALAAAPVFTGTLAITPTATVTPTVTASATAKLTPTTTATRPATATASPTATVTPTATRRPATPTPGATHPAATRPPTPTPTRVKKSTSTPAG